MRDAREILFLCAGAVLSCGSILFGFASWTLLGTSYFFWTTDFGSELTCVVLFAVAGFLCLPVCWLTSVVPYHPKAVPLAGTLMLLVSSTMLLVGVGLVSCAQTARALHDHSALNTSMLAALARSPSSLAVRSSFADMQRELKCCGVHSHADWLKVRSDLPASCCGERFNAKKGKICLVPHYTTGCLGPAGAQLRNTMSALSTLGALLVVILALTLVATAYSVGVHTMEGSEVASTAKKQPVVPQVLWLTAATLPSAVSQSALASPYPVPPPHAV